MKDNADLLAAARRLQDELEKQSPKKEQFTPDDRLAWHNLMQKRIAARQVKK